MGGDQIKRRLAAILAADVVGYSRLMGANEVATLAALKAHRAELIDAKIGEHSGRIVKLIGDGMLVEFPSVVNAVDCAAKIQREMWMRNAHLPADERIEFRIGINLGDVIVEGDDIYGDGVNIAARIESIARPGGIAVSASVRDHVGTKLELAFEDMGEQALKNIERPVRVYDVLLDTVPHENRTKTAAKDNRISIAILPFTNMSGSPEQEYFADGLTEDLIMALGKTRYLRVIGRHTTFQYKNRASNLLQLGRDLEVQYIVEGSVRRSANRIRVTAELIDSATGSHLWAERFDRDLADFLAVQDEIVHAISTQLGYSLVDAAATTRRAASTASLTAHDYFMRARSAMRRSAIIEERNYLLKAIEADPDFAPALAELAFFYGDDIYMQVSGEPVAELARLASHYTVRAIAANDGDPFAYRLIGNTMMMLGRHAEAKQQLEFALSLNPFDVGTTMDLGMLLGFSGQHEEGLAMIDRVFHLEPRLPPLLRDNAFWVRCAMGDPDGAKAELQKLDPPMAYHHLALAICLAGAGREEEAQTHVRSFEAGRSSWFDVEGLTVWFCKMLALPADRERFLKGVRILGYQV